jgi:DNA-directed RNA polymerase subunit RPC12/RpoP
MSTKERKAKVGRSTFADKVSKSKSFKLSQYSDRASSRASGSRSGDCDSPMFNEQEEAEHVGEEEEEGEEEKKKKSGRSNAIRIKDESRSIKCKKCGNMDCSDHIDEVKHIEEKLSPPYMCRNVRCKTINRFTAKEAIQCVSCGHRIVDKMRSTKVWYHNGR